MRRPFPSSPLSMTQQRLLNFCLAMLALALLSSLSACSEKPKTPKNTFKKVVHKKPVYDPSNLNFCPPANQLRKQKLTWGASGGWASTNPSFSTKILGYEGAQWQGIRNGTIICIYRGNNSAFPITLQTNHFVSEPRGPYWRSAGTIQQRGKIIKNCSSSTVQECGFPRQVQVWQSQKN